MSIWDDLKLVHLASNASFSRGLGYYQSKAVLSGEESEVGVCKGQVSGSQDNIYNVVININHPRKSSCTCPFAAGRRVICKHMVALYFYHFPEQADAVLAEWEEEEREKEERYQQWEADYTMFRQKKVDEVTAYVKSLSDDQIREELIKALLKEFEYNYPDYDEWDNYDDDYYF
ncbi:SWIM zinc finger family protein [Streptococcus oricebi]|uniref:SWIM zinc finger family protein n=1 Tax=Streptococcus oricebi TaxID=1547447 RepID=A0ABS5B2H4_9STRE|nr:SWIM zinc finger family protein [Streptococcus oricebi]MBP2623042.1 SWIM zinc finger family protein [Streptococcus oricebi]